jgi:hypothetical protein
MLLSTKGLSEIIVLDNLLPYGNRLFQYYCPIGRVGVGPYRLLETRFRGTFAQLAGVEDD